MPQTALQCAIVPFCRARGQGAPAFSGQREASCEMESRLRQISTALPEAETIEEAVRAHCTWEGGTLHGDRLK